MGFVIWLISGLMACSMLQQGVDGGGEGRRGARAVGWWDWIWI